MIKPADIKTEEDIKNVIKEVLKNKRVKVYLFGSRAKGTNTPRSDLDIAFLSDEDISYELSLLREIFEESHLIFFVDVVDLSKTGEEFKNTVLKEGRLWISL